MKFNAKFFLVIICIVSVLVGAVTAQIPQNKKELEDRHHSLLNEISETQKILSATQEEKKVSMSQLKALQNQVSSRQSLINNIDKEIRTVTQDITEKTKEINQLTSQIEKLRLLYAQSVRYSYKNQSAQNILAFILTADNFNDGMRRYQYMKKNRDFRKHQADQLRTGQKRIENNVKVLDVQKKKNIDLKNTQIEQKEVILEESKLTQEMVDVLKGKEKDLTVSIEKKRSDAKKLDSIIKNIIQEEIKITQKKKAEEDRLRREEENKRQQELARIEKEKEKQRRQLEDQNKQLEIERKKIQEERKQRELLATNEENKTVNSPKTNNEVVSGKPLTAPVSEKTKQPEENIIVAGTSSPNEPPKLSSKPDNPPPTYKNSLTPDMQTTSSNFAANKGRLPSPISGGYVSAPYGKYPHPLEPKVTLENMGIDLASQPGTKVKCVFNGSVTTVVSIAGTFTVIINHGEYFTVYSNLSSVTVSKGQIVAANQQVGVVGLNDEGEHIVHFEVCRVGANNSVVNENPSAWISR